MLVKYNSLSPAGSISSRSCLLYQLLQQINAKYSRVMLHWATAAVWTISPKIQYKPAWVRFVLVFAVEFQDSYISLFSCIGHFYPFCLVLQNIILADLSVFVSATVLSCFGAFLDQMTSFSLVSQSPNCFKGTLNYIKLGNWGEEGNCLLPKQMDMKRSLDSSTEGKAQQKQEFRFLRNKDSLVEVWRCYSACAEMCCTGHCFAGRESGMCREKGCCWLPASILRNVDLSTDLFTGQEMCFVDLCSCPTLSMVQHPPLW